MAPYKKRYYKKRYKKYYKRKYKKKTKVSNATSRSRTSIRASAYIDSNIGIPSDANATISQLFNPYFEFATTSVYSQPHVFTISTWTSDIVQLYQKLYDEVKVDSFMVEVTVANPIGVGGDVDCVRLFTAWDRKGCYPDTYYNNETFPTPEVIMKTGSCSSFVINNNSPTTVVRYIKASDFMEKYTFVDSTSVSNIACKVQGADGTATMCEAWWGAQANMTFFSPTFMCFLGLVGGPPGTPKYFKLAFKLTAQYTFRCPKFTAGNLDFNRKKQVTVNVPVATKEAIAEAISVTEDKIAALEDAIDNGPATAAAATAGALSTAPGGAVMVDVKDPISGMKRPERIMKVGDYKAAVKARRMETGNLTDQPDAAYYFQS